MTSSGPTVDLSAVGVDVIDCSSGGLTEETRASLEQEALLGASGPVVNNTIVAPAGLFVPAPAPNEIVRTAPVASSPTSTVVSLRPRNAPRVVHAVIFVSSSF